MGEQFGWKRYELKCSFKVPRPAQLALHNNVNDNIPTAKLKFAFWVLSCVEKDVPIPTRSPRPDCPSTSSNNKQLARSISCAPDRHLKIDLSATSTDHG